MDRAVLGYWDYIVVCDVGRSGFPGIKDAVRGHRKLRSCSEELHDYPHQIPSDCHQTSSSTAESRSGLAQLLQLRTGLRRFYGIMMNHAKLWSSLLCLCYCRFLGKLAFSWCLFCSARTWAAVTIALSSSGASFEGGDVPVEYTVEDEERLSCLFTTELWDCHISWVKCIHPPLEILRFEPTSFEILRCCPWYCC